MNLRLLYLYLFSFVGLLIVIIGSIQTVNLALRMTLFKNVDTYEVYPMTDPNGKMTETKEEAILRQTRETSRQRQREFISAFSMLAVGLPVYMYHWKLIKKESKK